MYYIKGDVLIMIKEIYHGKMFPSANIPNHPNPEYEKISSEFEKTLTPEQLEIYHQLSDLQCNDAAFYSEAAYELGFKDGAKIMMAVLKD